MKIMKLRELIKNKIQEGIKGTIIKKRNNYYLQTDILDIDFEEVWDIILEETNNILFKITTDKDLGEDDFLKKSVKELLSEGIVGEFDVDDKEFILNIGSSGIIIEQLFNRLVGERISFSVEFFDSDRIIDEKKKYQAVEMGDDVDSN